MAQQIKINTKDDEGRRKVTHKGMLVGWITQKDYFSPCEVTLKHKAKTVQCKGMVEAIKVLNKYDWVTIVGHHSNGMPHTHYQKPEVKVHKARFSES